MEPNRSGGRLRLACLVVAAIPTVALVACGETRRPIGEECLRNEDCLSGVCAARSCASAPSLVTGASDPPDEEEPRIPGDDASSSPSDAAPDTRG